MTEITSESLHKSAVNIAQVTDLLLYAKDDLSKQEKMLALGAKTTLEENYKTICDFFENSRKGPRSFEWYTHQARRFYDVTSSKDEYARFVPNIYLSE